MKDSPLVNLKLLNLAGVYFLTAAVKKWDPQALQGRHKVTSTGFFADFCFKKRVGTKDLEVLVENIHKLLKTNHFVKKAEGFQTLLTSQPFRKEVAQKNSMRNVSTSTYGVFSPNSNVPVASDFSLSKNGVPASKITFFKLFALGGAYWEDDPKKKQLTRIYGAVFNSQKELTAHTQAVKDEKLHDHRFINKKVGFFTFSDDVGPGLPLWLPDGMVVKNIIKQTVLQMDCKYGFHEVATPVLGDETLYKTSGHLAHYKDDMFPAIPTENRRLILRPMTCPHHVLLYARKERSYAELPVRYSEQSMLYRHEKSGALLGLERTRAMELTDGHSFLRKDQIAAEFKHCYNLIQEVLHTFGVKVYRLVLATYDPNGHTKYYPDPKMWAHAETTLKNTLQKLAIPFETSVGSAAFYGPKVDVEVITATGKIVTLSTIQLDFLLPQRFKISYVDAAQKHQTPVLIHRGLIGTYERFVAILLEQKNGVLPFWLSPKQIAVLPVNPSVHGHFSEKIYKELKKLGYRVTVDASATRLGKKIQTAHTQGFKFLVIIGNKEVEAEKITVRELSGDANQFLSLQDFVQKCKDLDDTHK